MENSPPFESETGAFLTGEDGQLIVPAPDIQGPIGFAVSDRFHWFHSCSSKGTSHSPQIT